MQCHSRRTCAAQLAPGGHLGRFIVWTKSAFEALDSVFGTVETESGAKRGYRLPRVPMTNSDLTRLINSDEIQSIVNAPKVRPLVHHGQRQRKMAGRVAAS